jgi:chemotaxis protein methyltransferase CheR
MKKILTFILETRGKDLSVWSPSFLQKTIELRIGETASCDFSGYLKLIKNDFQEIDRLLNSLNISYSLFFRNPIDYSLIERYILPGLFRKNSNNPKSVRIWSAACAGGQEPYSVAMMADKLICSQFDGFQIMIIASDISESALNKAKEGDYPANNLQNVMFSYISDYFTKKGEVYSVTEKVRKMVEFANYDLLDTKTSSPPFGIFGGYDISICCNLLIYYKPEVQKTILKKLYNSLVKGGYLMVDESEKDIVKSFKGFRLFSEPGNIFIKN